VAALDPLSRNGFASHIFDAKIWVRGTEIHQKFRIVASKNIWMKKGSDVTVSIVILYLHGIKVEN
jgi:hypothetical protein